MSKLPSRLKLKTYLALTKVHERKTQHAKTAICCGCTWDSIGPPRTRILICGYATVVFAFSAGLAFIITGAVLEMLDLLILGVLLAVGGGLFTVLFVVQHKPLHGCNKVDTVAEDAVVTISPKQTTTREKELIRRPSDFLNDTVASSQQQTSSNISEFTQSFRSFDQHINIRGNESMTSYPPRIPEERDEEPAQTTRDTIPTSVKESNETELIELNENVQKVLPEIVAPSSPVTEMPVPPATEETSRGDVDTDHDPAPTHVYINTSGETEVPVYPYVTRTDSRGHLTLTTIQSHGDDLDAELTENAELEPGVSEEGITTEHRSKKKKKRKKRRETAEHENVNSDNGASFSTPTVSNDDVTSVPDSTHIPYTSLA